MAAAAAVPLPKVAMAALAAIILLHSTSIRTQAQNTAQDFVDAHNSARSTVGVSPVSWNDTLGAYATDYASTRADDCSVVNSNTTEYGEIVTLQPPGTNAADLVSSWLSYQQYYSYSDNTCAAGFENECGVYKQLVWANTSIIGCAGVQCSSSAAAAGVFFVCEYYPPGNVPGERPY